MHRSARLPFLLITVFLDMLGLGLVVPIAPRLITVLSGDPASGARWYGVLVACYALPQFLAAPLLGGLSDRYGRRPVLLVSLAMLGLDYLATAVAPSVVLLFASRALAGATAGTYTVVNAYVADVTPREARARAYGRIGAVSAVGLTAGPVIGGLLGAASLRAPFLVAAALALANVGYGLFVLPESRPPQPRPPRTRSALANPVGSILALWRRPGLTRLVWARLCGEVARQLNQVIWVLFATARFGWSTVELGAAIAVGAACGTVTGWWLVDPCVRRLGERGSVLLGSLGWAVALAASALAPRGWLLYPSMALFSLGSIAGTAVQTLLSRGVPEAEQGRLQGALTSIGSLTETLLPVPAAALFAWSVTVRLPGLGLLVAAGFLVGAAVLGGSAPAGQSS